MDASHEQMHRVDRARLVESSGARDDSPSWNLGRARQGDTIRVDGASPQGGGQRTSRSPSRGASDCKESGRMKNGASMTRLPGNDESSKKTQSAKWSSSLEDAFVQEERGVEETHPSDGVTEMHNAMCKSDWPDE